MPVGTSTISKLDKNETINMESVMKICRVLECDIGDIVEMTENTDQPPKKSGGIANQIPDKLCSILQNN